MDCNRCEKPMQHDDCATMDITRIYPTKDSSHTIELCKKCWQEFLRFLVVGDTCEEFTPKDILRREA